MNRKFIIAPCLLVLPVVCFAVDHHRWPIKTQPHQKTQPHKIPLKKVLSLPDPPDVSMNDIRYETKLIPTFSNALNVNEGNLVKVEGYLQLVAYEDNDDEYHIQISPSKTVSDNCLIVEVPLPKNAPDPVLRDKYESVRSFVRDRILHDADKEPSKSGNIIGGRAYVYVTGQLFYDDAHNHNQVRGKKGLRSNTLWEIHPITEMGFAVKP